MITRASRGTSGAAGATASASSPRSKRPSGARLARASIVSAALASVLLAQPFASLAQSGRAPATAAANGDEPAQLSVQEVRIPVTVRGSSGRPAVGLSARDFLVTEDGARQSVASCAVEDGPLDVLLLLDASPDVYKEVTHELDAEVDGPRVGASAVDKILGPKPQPDPIRPATVADLPPRAISPPASSSGSERWIGSRSSRSPARCSSFRTGPRTRRTPSTRSAGATASD